MKRGGCPRCGSVLRGRGVGYCAWCNTQSAAIVVTESPGSLWLMAQGLLSVDSVDWRVAMCSGAGVSGALLDMHVSPMSSDSDVELLDTLNSFDMRVSPMSSDSDAELLATLSVLGQPVSAMSSGSYMDLSRSCVACALGVLLHDESLASIFSYCDDYCRLSLASRYLYEHGIFVALYRHWYDALHEARFDSYIEERALTEQSGIDVGELCHSCGLRAGVDVLSFVECWECYAEHND